MNFYKNRKAHNLTASEIVKRTGIAEQRINQLDQDTPPTKHEAMLIASLAQVEIYQLFGAVAV